MKPILVKLVVLVAVFAVVTAIASVAGAKNLGTAMTFGQVAFGITLVGLMLWGTRGVVRAAQRDAAS